MRRVYGCLITLSLLFVVMLAFSPLFRAEARIGGCPPFHLRTESGEIINPLTGANADQPYSTRQTCGACHDYDKITDAYHFQQGRTRISDDFDPDKPWVLSDGMFGKM